jgi:hypothetical protein
MKSLTLEELRDTITTISAVQCDSLVENCIVAFEESGHETGCTLPVSGDEPTVFTIE